MADTHNENGTMFFSDCNFSLFGGKGWISGFKLLSVQKGDGGWQLLLEFAWELSKYLILNLMKGLVDLPDS